MISAKDLSEEQKAAVEEWARNGAQLPDIQKRLIEEFELNVTYMDTRFLVLDLGVELRPEEKDEPAGSPDPSGEAVSAGPGGIIDIEPAAADAGQDPAPSPSPAGGVTVTTDELARPGALVSGQVTFSDGQRAVWLIDEMGRLGLDPDTPGYQPSQADAMAFETELRRLLERQ